MNILSLAASLCILAGPAGAADGDPVPPPQVAFAIEPGINSLASMGGAVVSYHPSSRFAVDAGGGFGVANLRYGLRGRLFFDPWGRDFFPFVGISYSHTQGWGDDVLDMHMTVTRNGESRQYDFGILVDPADYLGALLGFELRFGHVLLRPGFGWAQMLGGKSWRVVEGEAPQGKDAFGLTLLYGSGPAGFLAVGFYF